MDANRLKSPPKRHRHRGRKLALETRARWSSCHSTTGRAARPALIRLARWSPNRRATIAPATFSRLAREGTVHTASPPPLNLYKNDVYGTCQNHTHRRKQRMRINIEIDDRLMARAMRLSRAASKREVSAGPRVARADQAAGKDSLATRKASLGREL